MSSSRSYNSLVRTLSSLGLICALAYTVTAQAGPARVDDFLPLKSLKGKEFNLKGEWRDGFMGSNGQYLLIFVPAKAEKIKDIIAECEQAAQVKAAKIPQLPIVFVFTQLQVKAKAHLIATLKDRVGFIYALKDADSDPFERLDRYAYAIVRNKTIVAADIPREKVANLAKPFLTGR